MRIITIIITKLTIKIMIKETAKKCSNIFDAFDENLFIPLISVNN